MRFLTVVFLILAATSAEAKGPGLADLAFLEGHWRGEQDGLVFEEVWIGPAAGVMTGMARGYREDKVSVLEYIVVEETAGAVVMRFKHFHPNYETWETGGPAVLKFAQAKKNDALFRNDDPQAEVQSVRYVLQSDGVLRADVVLIADGKPDGFSLSFTKED